LWDYGKKINGSQKRLCLREPFFLPAEKANDKIRLRPTFFHFS
jgi:hypothetical protein